MKSSPVKIGIIGCGTIGAALAKAIPREFAGRARLAYLCEHHAEKAEKLRKQISSSVRIVEMDYLIRHSDIIIEAASAAISEGIASRALAQGKQILILSVGGLLLGDWRKLLKTSKGRLWIPSGAVAGIDAIVAAGEAKISKVKLITRKPPAGLDSAPYFKTRRFPMLKGKREVRVFKGNALQAMKAFPQNINVSAVLSLAGLGPQKTEVEIWTSLSYRTNTHEVFAEGDFGSLHAVTRNVPSRENPKTSALAVYSALATLRRLFSRVRIGT